MNEEKNPESRDLTENSKKCANKHCQKAIKDNRSALRKN